MYRLAAGGDGGGGPPITHVHGLGVDPGDGALIVATHYGTFRMRAGGGSERIGDSLQDTMGFTVVGWGRFLGSGHPESGHGSQGASGPARAHPLRRRR